MGGPGFTGPFTSRSIAFFECGRPCERLLGSERFLLLSLGAMAANALAMSFTQGVNGSSLVIWAWGPPLFLALHYTRSQQRRPTDVGAAARIRAVLTIMYVGVTLMMTMIPYAFGWRGNPIIAIFLGNLYHRMATIVGVLGAIAMAQHIKRRMSPSGPHT